MIPHDPPEHPGGRHAGDHDADDLTAEAHAVLEAAWRPDGAHCVPNAVTYPHLWLWDSCFHALAWHGLGDERAVDELGAVFAAQTPAGFVPHMRYGGPMGYHRGPRRDASSFTQPPVYGIVLDRLRSAGVEVPDGVVDAARRGLRHLFATRRHATGLVRIVHPWESGTDDSPRWDAWTGATRWHRVHWSVIDQELLSRVRFADDAAIASDAFEVCPVGFDAIAVHSARLVAAITGDDELSAAAEQCAAAIDHLLWDDAQGLWHDLPVVGPATAGAPGGSSLVPTLDGVLGALVTADAERANRALDQVLHPDRFGAPFGVRYVPPTHPTYQPDAYWRGPAWPPCNYLVWLAAHRWGRRDVVTAIEAMMQRGVRASGFAEYWNPDTGRGLGAIPQTWAAVVVAMRDGCAPGHDGHAGVSPVPPPGAGGR